MNQSPPEQKFALEGLNANFSSGVDWFTRLSEDPMELDLVRSTLFCIGSIVSSSKGYSVALIY